MFELKTNFYYPDTEMVDSPTHGVPAGEAVEPTETTPTTATKKVEPRTRKEHYLAKIAGEDVTIPEPKTRTEHYLNEIANKPTPSDGDGGIFPVTTTITVTLIPGEMEQYSFSFSDANHTETEILEALAENKLPVLFATVVYEGESMPGRSTFYFASHSKDGIKFEALNENGNYIRVFNGNKVYGKLA